MTAGFDELEFPEIEAHPPTFSKHSTLHVWPGSMNTIWAQRAEGNHEWSNVVQIPPFSALIFRQDLVHAGFKYKMNNLRLHFYMDLNADDYNPQNEGRDSHSFPYANWLNGHNCNRPPPPVESMDRMLDIQQNATTPQCHIICHTPALVN